MKDKRFKNLKHNSLGYEVIKNGQELAKGYKPDVVLKKDNHFIILESEVSTSRKGYIGGMVKAAKFLSSEFIGILIYVIEIRKNTTPAQIARHLKEYYEWIAPLTNLKSIYIISDNDYCKNEEPLEISSKKFNHLAKKV